MLGDLTFRTGLWLIGALLPVLALSKWYDGLAIKHRSLVVIAVSVVTLLFCWAAYREYIGANYVLRYRVCGGPSVIAGYVNTQFFGIEIVNKHGVPLYMQPKSSFMRIGNQSSTLDLVRVTTIVKPSGRPQDDGKFTDYIEFDPARDPKAFAGTVRYTFDYGSRENDLNKKLVIEGRFDVLFSEDGRFSSFRYTPTSDSSTTYVGMCDIASQVSGERTSTLS